MSDAGNSMSQEHGGGAVRERQTCFVVMPFGTKPRGPGQAPHDFDKIYRVVIKRAVERAGMTCIRADETSGSRLIHTDMFRDLRDQPLVIADLSLQNPNVFYELGIRHVMSRSGTVLMCERGSVPLPFDIGLSRVVLYDYDGRSLDWEEAERLVEQLRVALLESATGAPDSPVHALLERVLRDDAQEAPSGEWGPPGGQEEVARALERYAALVASSWRDSGIELATLFEGHRDNAFGCSALGRYVLAAEKLPREWAPRIAGQLSDLGEFGLASEVYERLRREGLAGYGDLVRYANAYSESHPDIAGADRAIALVAEALAQAEKEFGEEAEGAGAVGARAYCMRRSAALRQWRWQLSQDPVDLREAIAAHGEAIALMVTSRRLGSMWAAATTGPLAQSHLKRLLLLRIQAGNDELDDPKGDLQSILAIRELPGDEPKAVSYLRWYRSIALADSGASDRVRQSALEAFAKDADLMHRGPEFAEIGRRQYVQLRRFLEQYSRWLRHPELIGLIGQTLQARH